MRSRLTAVALTSTTLISLELIWTRIFSAEFFYTYAFLTLSLAVLGLGVGGLALRLIAGINGRHTVALALTAVAVSAAAGPVLVFRLGLDFSQLHQSWSMVGRFVLTLMLLGAPFFFGGMALAALFKRTPGEMPRLYMADLLGAGLGVSAAIVAMNVIGTPQALVWSALPTIAAAVLVGVGRWRFAPAAVLLGLAWLSPLAEPLLEVEREERAPVIYRHWDAMAKIKVYDFGGRYRGINIDNVANTPLIPFDGDWQIVYADTAKTQWDIDVGHLIAQFDSCTFLSLGAGGGSDVLQALDKQATSVHAVEVIPHINRMMLRGDPDGYVVHDSTVLDESGRVVTSPDYTGRIYHDPRVRVVTEDARTYVRRHPGAFDVIFSLSANTWAALGSGSFALAENYLFTKEAFQDYWRALSPGGFLSLEHQVYMPRIVSALLAALDELGVESPREHFAVYNLPRMRRNILLVSKRPLTDAIRTGVYGGVTPERQETVHLLYPAPDSLEENLINRIVRDGWEAHVGEAAIDISPATDDRPFIAQLGRWQNLTSERLATLSQYAEFSGFPVSKLTVTVILAVVVLLVLPLNLLPYLRSGPKLRAVPWLYFFAIGVAFMALEVVLIQRYTLVIGASVYSTATVLLTLLLAAGVGSRLSVAFGDAIPFFGIVLWLLLELLLFEPFVAAISHVAMAWRIAASAAVLAPLGFFMGMPFPKAVLRVGALVDWGFAVNGAASVLGATAAIMVAFTWGFHVALWACGGVYLIALALLQRQGAWRPVPAPTSEP